jgi:hypothetical protein
MPNLHTHNKQKSETVGVVTFSSLSGKGRIGWEGRVKNGVRMKHMITLE